MLTISDVNVYHLPNHEFYVTIPLYTIQLADSLLFYLEDIKCKTANTFLYEFQAI